MNRRKFLVGGTLATSSAIVTMAKIQTVHVKHGTKTHDMPRTFTYDNSRVIIPNTTSTAPHGPQKPVNHETKKVKYPPFTKHKKINVKLTKFDKNVLVKTIWGETRGENKIGRMAVVHVILNRKYKDNPFFKNKTVSQLCLKKYQFSCWLDKWKMNHIKNDDTYRDIKNNVMEAITLYENGIDYSNGALFYYSDIMDKPPTWANDYQQVNKIGLHNFFMV